MAELDEVATLTVQGEKGPGVDQVVASLNQVSEAQTRVGVTAEASAKVQESAATKQLSAAAAYDKLRASIDSSYASQLKFGAGVSTLDKAFSQGLISETSYAAQMENLHAKYSGVVQDATQVGGSLGFLNSIFGQHTAEVGRANETSKAYRETIHTLDPALKEMGASVGGLTAFTGAARGGIELLAVAVGGALVAALEVAADRAQVATSRLSTLLSSTSSGEQSFAALGDIALKTGTDIGVLATSYESLLRTVTGPTNMISASGAVGLGAGPQKTIQDAFATIAEDLKLGGANAAQTQQAFAALFDTIQKGGAISVQTIEKLDAISPKLAQDLAAALGQGGGQQGVQKLEELAAEGELTAARIINAFAGLKPQIDAQFQGWEPTLGQAFDKLKSSFDELLTSIARGAGFRDLADAVDTLSSSLEELGRHPQPLINGFKDVVAVFEGVGAAFHAAWVAAQALNSSIDAIVNGLSRLPGWLGGTLGIPGGSALGQALGGAPNAPPPIPATNSDQALGMVVTAIHDGSSEQIAATNSSGTMMVDSVTSSGAGTVLAMQSAATQITGGINMLPPGLDGIHQAVFDNTTSTAGALSSGQQADSAGHAATKSAVDATTSAINSSADRITSSLNNVDANINGLKSGATQTSVTPSGGIGGGVFDQIDKGISNFLGGSAAQAGNFLNKSGGTGTVIPNQDLIARTSLALWDAQYGVGGYTYDYSNYGEPALLTVGGKPFYGGSAGISTGYKGTGLNTGIDVTLGGGGGPDSIYAPLYLSPGERLIVLPVGQSGMLPATGLPGSLSAGGFASGLGPGGATGASFGGLPVNSFAGAGPGGATGQTLSGLPVNSFSGAASVASASPAWSGGWGPGGMTGTSYGGAPVFSFASGIDYMIPGSGPPDSVSMPLHVSPGERLIVLPASMAGLVPSLGLPGLSGAAAGGVFAASGLDTWSASSRPASGVSSDVAQALAELKTVIASFVDKMASGGGPTLVQNITAPADSNLGRSANQIAAEAMRILAAQSLRR